MDIKNLEIIGLTPKEIKLYDALLELGECTRSKLAKTSSISPSKVYDVAQKLIEKGLITSIKKNGFIHFSPASPSKINEYLELKKNTLLTNLQKETHLISELMPTLLLKYQKTKEETNIEAFYGWNGLKTAYNEILNSMTKTDINYVFGASLGQNSKQSDQFYSRYLKEIKKIGFKQKIIYNEEVKDHFQRLKIYPKNSKHEIRFLLHNTLVETNIYKEGVLLIMLFNNPIVIRIKGKEAINSFKQYFDSMWKLAKK